MMKCVHGVPLIGPVVLWMDTLPYPLAGMIWIMLGLAWAPWTYWLTRYRWKLWFGGLRLLDVEGHSLVLLSLGVKCLINVVLVALAILHGLSLLLAS